MSFGTDCHSIYFMSTIFLKDNTDQALVPQFQLAYICDTTNPSNKILVMFYREVYHMWWGNQVL